MTRKIGAGLYQNYNAWYVRKMIPKELRIYFGNKRYLFKNLETSSQGVAVGRAEPIMQEWKDLIAKARRKHNGEVVDVQEAVKVAEAKMASFNDPWRGIAAVGHDLKINLESMDPAERADKLFVLGQAAGKATPILQYLDEWLSETKYAAAGATECRNYFEKRFSKQFKYWEAIGADELKAYIRGRQNGSDGAKAWSDRSCERHLNWVKQFWNWMLDNDHIDVPNLIDPARLMKKKANTRQNRIETQTESNLPYSTPQCWEIVDAAKKDGYNMLAELILLGMYTGCRINELCSLKIEDVGPDYFQIQTGKTEASTRRLPIHSEIKQLVERLVQNSTDGYLLSGLSCSNSDGNRSKAISKKFGHHKRAMGFGEGHTFHSFRSTFVTRMMNAEANSTLAKKLVGHKIQDITWGIYAGDADWEKKLELMELVKYPREVA